jgi:RNA polymerase sigma factor (sigma-70 family)
MSLLVDGHTTAARGVNDANFDRADTRIMNATEIDTATLAALLRSASAGRDGALDELIRLCGPYVETKARKYAWSNTDPDDIVQEVWIQLIEHVDRIREPLALLGWLNVVTRRLAGHLGQRGGRQIPTDFDDAVASASCTEDQAIANHERRQVTAAIREAVGNLDDGDRSLLQLLHPKSGTPCYADISRRVHRPVGSLGPTRRRILDRLGQDPAVRHVLAHQ